MTCHINFKLGHYRQVQRLALRLALLLKRVEMKILRWSSGIVALCLLAARCRGQEAAEALYDQGWQKFNSNQVDAALLLFSQAIQTGTNPDLLGRAYESRGQAKERKNDDRGAIADFNRAIQLNPAGWKLYYERAEIEPDVADAIIDCDLAIKFNPQASDVYSLRARLFARKQWLDAALADFNTSIRLNPTNVSAYRGRALARVRSNDFDGAIADYSVLIQINPKYGRYYYDPRAWAKVGKGDREGALTDMNAAIQLDPTNSYLYSDRGWMQCDRNAFDGALTDAAQSMKLCPTNPEAYLVRGMARLGKNDRTGARDDFSRAIDLTDTAVYYSAVSSKEVFRDLNQGWIDFAKGDDEAAVASWNQAVAESPYVFKWQIQPWIDKARDRSTGSGR